MQKRKRYPLVQRLARIDYIKNELNLKIKKSIQKNSYINYLNSYIAKTSLDKHKDIKKKSISRHRMQCFINNSFKVPNKNYLLSRFTLNKLTRDNTLCGLSRIGW